jgi:hypothetical protein
LLLLVRVRADWNRVNSLVEVDEIQLVVVHAKRIVLNGRQQEEAPLVANAHVSDFFGRHAQAVELVIVFYVPHADVLLRSGEEMLCIELTE